MLKLILISCKLLTALWSHQVVLLVELQQLMVTKAGFGEERKDVPLSKHRKGKIANAAACSSL